MDFANELIYFRAAHDMTQTELSEYIGTSQRMLSMYESGKVKPTKKNLLKYRQMMKKYERSK